MHITKTVVFTSLSKPETVPARAATQTPINHNQLINKRIYRLASKNSKTGDIPAQPEHFIDKSGINKNLTLVVTFDADG